MFPSVFTKRVVFRFKLRHQLTNVARFDKRTVSRGLIGFNVHSVASAAKSVFNSSRNDARFAIAFSLTVRLWLLILKSRRHISSCISLIVLTFGISLTSECNGFKPVFNVSAILILSLNLTPENPHNYALFEHLNRYNFGRNGIRFMAALRCTLIPSFSRCLSPASPAVFLTVRFAYNRLIAAGAFRNVRVFVKVTRF